MHGVAHQRRWADGSDRDFGIVPRHLGLPSRLRDRLELAQVVGLVSRRSAPRLSRSS